MVKLNLERGSLWKEIETLRTDKTFKVIPRPLRFLEVDGPPVKLFLVHEDFRCGNTAVDRAADLSFLYDSFSFYAHNKCKDDLCTYT